jgi:translation initiation factor IF-1
MAYYLSCEVTVGNFRLTGVNEVVINSSWRTLGDTCTLKLPNISKYEGKQTKLEDRIKTGDKVIVKLGYDGHLITEFVGFVSEILPKTPFEIRCEDANYTLKRSELISQSWRSTNLKEVLNFCLTKVKNTEMILGEIPEVTLAPFRLERVTVAQALQKLKDEYLLAAYFRGNSLFVGLPYTESMEKLEGSRSKFHFQKNIATESLVYKKKEDVRLKAKVINILKNNEKIETEVGDSDGEQRTIHLRIPTTDKKVLERIGLVELEKYKYEGYRGKFVSFGIPYLIHSGTVELEDENYPNRKGKYICESLKTTFGMNGFRREIELGKKISV